MVLVEGVFALGNVLLQEEVGLQWGYGGAGGYVGGVAVTDGPLSRRALVGLQAEAFKFSDEVVCLCGGFHCH